MSPAEKRSPLFHQLVVYLLFLILLLPLLGTLVYSLSTSWSANANRGAGAAAPKGPARSSISISSTVAPAGSRRPEIRRPSDAWTSPACRACRASHPGAARG